MVVVEAEVERALPALQLAPQLLVAVHPHDLHRQRPAVAAGVGLERLAHALAAVRIGVERPGDVEVDHRHEHQAPHRRRHRRDGELDPIDRVAEVLVEAGPGVGQDAEAPVRGHAAEAEQAHRRLHLSPDAARDDERPVGGQVVDFCAQCRNS